MSDPQPNAASKSCASCGIDVTSRKRTKDAQGRYYCEDCVARAKTAKAVANPPPAAKANEKAVASATKVSANDDNAFLLELGGSAMATKDTIPCTECGRALTEGTVVCTGCGFNVQTGKRLAVKVVRAKAVKSEGSDGGESLAQNPVALALLCIIVVVGLLGGGFFVPVLFLFAALAHVVTAVGVWITCIVTAWKNDGPVWGLVCIFCTGVGSLVWVLAKCDDARLKTIVGAVAFNAIMFMIVSRLGSAAITGATP